MKISKVTVVLLLALAACNRDHPRERAGIPPESVPSAAVPPGAPDNDDACAGGPCEKEARMLWLPKMPGGPSTPARVKLSPEEHASLSAALAAGADHVHADVSKGRFVFSADAGQHLQGKEPDISLDGGPARKLVASEPAARLLAKREIH